MDDGRGPLIGRTSLSSPPTHVPLSPATPSKTPVPPPPRPPWRPSCESPSALSLSSTYSPHPSKALKVVDLKHILNRAGVSIPSKSNKNDLIARILASPAALDAYNAQHSPKPAEPAPKEPAVPQDQVRGSLVQLVSC